MPPEPGSRSTDEFQIAVHQLDELVREFESYPSDEVREHVMALLQAVDAVHRMGLARLIRVLQDLGQGDLVEIAASDPVIRTLLLLYDLLPSDPFCQAARAIAKIHPYIQSHGGEVEVLDVVDGVVHLRLLGVCVGCPSASVTLQEGIRKVLEKEMPGFVEIQVEESETAGQTGGQR